MFDINVKRQLRCFFAEEEELIKVFRGRCADQNIGPSDPSMAAAAVNQRGKESRMSTVRRTRTELKRTTSVQLSRGSREAEIGARPGLEGEVADLEVELEAVEERVSRLMTLIEEKMPLYKQVGCWDIL